MVKNFPKGIVGNRKRLLGVFLGFAIAWWTPKGYCKEAGTDTAIRPGPVPIVNQSPVQLLFLQAMPDQARTLPKGRGAFAVNTTITNTLQSQEATAYSGTMDLEMLRFSFDLKYGLHDRLELDLSLPFSYSYAGFFDGHILDVEEFFGNARSVRENEDPDQYRYHIKKGDRTIIGGEKRSTGLGDLVLRAKAKIWDETDRRPCVSARFSLKVPTGDEDRALGSGEFDFGLGLLFQKNMGRFTAYLNGDVIFPGDAYEEEGVSVEEFFQVMFGLEYRFTQRLSAVAQVTYNTRPFEDTGLDMLDKRIFDLLLGVTYVTEKGFFIQGGGVEDIYDSVDAGADITFFLNVGVFF